MSDTTDKADKANKKGKGSPPPRWFLRLFTKIHVFLYTVSNGRWMSEAEGRRVILVEMTGARSGRVIRLPVMYVPYEEGYLLVGSQGGAPKHPVWYYNLLKNPEVRITFEGKTTPMTARLATDEEKAELWLICCEYYPPYQTYQERTDRKIPVFICS